MTEPIHRTVYTVEVFSIGPFDAGLDPLGNINYAIHEGDCIGNVEQTSIEAVPREEIKAHMLRIGNAGDFFEEMFPDEDDLLYNRIEDHDADEHVTSWDGCPVCEGWDNLAELRERLRLPEPKDG